MMKHQCFIYPLSQHSNYKVSKQQQTNMTYYWLAYHAAKITCCNIFRGSISVCPHGGRPHEHSRDINITCITTWTIFCQTEIRQFCIVLL